MAQRSNSENPSATDEENSEEFPRDFVGSKYTVRHCQGARESIEAIVKKVNRKKETLENSVSLVIEHLANGLRLPKTRYRSEGNLPSQKKFYALKAGKIRGYCWLSQRKKNTIFISHYIFKAQDKLNGKDTNLVCDNWKRIEENGDDC